MVVVVMRIMMVMMRRRRRMVVMVVMMAVMMLLVVSNGDSSVDILLDVKQGFKNQWQLASWSNNESSSAKTTTRAAATNLLLPPPCNGWKGITCSNGSAEADSGGGGGGDESSSSSSVAVIWAVELRRQSLGGGLSPRIASLGDLRRLDLSGNAIGGPIPAAIFAALPRLEELDLSGNRFAGSVPADWGAAAALRDANLAGNRLGGGLPGGVFAAPSLRRLRLGGNALSGPIPPEACAASRLLLLSLGPNLLSGPVPAALGNNASSSPLRALLAASNSLSGPLPDSLARLRRLRRLQLQGNRLGGPIPQAWASLASTLVSLNLSSNLLQGPVPEPLARAFPAASFAGNDALCGPPFPDPCPAASLPPPLHPPINNKPSKSPRKLSRSILVQIVVGSLLGAMLVLLCALLLYAVVVPALRRRRRRRTLSLPASARQQQQQPQHQQQQFNAEQHQLQQQQEGGGGSSTNWFDSQAQAGRRQGKFVVFDADISAATAAAGFEDLVANAGFFDTAHVVGKGRFATTYRCEIKAGSSPPPRSSTRLLAIKVFKFPVSAPAFERDMDVLLALRHRYLLTVKGYYSDALEKAVICDYMPRGTLYSLLHAGSSSSSGAPAVAQAGIDWATRQTIAFGTAKALEYLHRYEIVHKDITSANILLDDDADGERRPTRLVPRLADFGILQLVSNRAIDDAVDKPPYTAPEVLLTGTYTARSDVYGFGIVLLELITGKKPMLAIDAGVEEMDLVSWVAMHRDESRGGRDVVDPLALDTCPFPEYVNTALKLALDCLSREPGSRPPMSHVAFVLDGLASNPSPLRSPTSPPFATT